MPVITARQLAEYVPKISEKTAESLMRFTALDKVNDIYDRGGELLGPDFAQFLLNDINMDYRIGNAERLKNLPDNFITISNHPYGSLDGIILVDFRRELFDFWINLIFDLENTDFALLALILCLVDCDHGE